MKRRNHPPWADLPQELLSTIATFCINSTNPFDNLCFRSVCKSFHSSSPIPSFLLSSPLPLPIPPPPYSLLNRYAIQRKRYMLSATVIYSLRPPVQNPLTTPQSWVVFLDQLNPGKLIIRHPVTGNEYPLLSSFPRLLNLLDFHAVELGRYYNLNSDFSHRVDACKPIKWYSGNEKVVLLPDKLGAVTLSDEGKLGLVKLNVKEGERQWETLHDGKGFRVDDVVEFKGRVIGIDRRGRVYEIGCRDSKMGPVVPPIAGGGGRRKRLVESLGRLYLVVRCNVRGKMGGKTCFKVYELNEENKKWVEVSTIGDRIFFFGRCFSFSALSQEVGGYCQGDCIIFQRYSFQSYDGDCDDSTLFSQVGKHDLMLGVCHLEDAARFDTIGSYIEYSSILWPPPAWIWPDGRLKQLENLETVADNLIMRFSGDNLKESRDLSQQGKNRILNSGRLVKSTVEDAKDFNSCVGVIEKALLKKAGCEDSPLYRKAINMVLISEAGTSRDGTEELSRCIDSLDGQLALYMKADFVLSTRIFRMEEMINEFQGIIFQSGS